MIDAEQANKEVALLPYLKISDTNLKEMFSDPHSISSKTIGYCFCVSSQDFLVQPVLQEKPISLQMTAAAVSLNMSSHTVPGKSWNNRISSQTEKQRDRHDRGISLISMTHVNYY